MERGRGAASAGRGGLQAQEGQSRGCRVKSAWGHQERPAKARKAASLPTPSCSMSRGPQRTLAPEELSFVRLSRGAPLDAQLTQKQCNFRNSALPRWPAWVPWGTEKVT